MKKILLLTGDPNSVNSEIIIKAWNKLNNQTKKRIYFVSDYNLLKKQFKLLKFHSKMIKVKTIHENTKSADLKIIDIKVNTNKTFNVEQHLASKYIKGMLNYAHKIALKDRNIIGIINCAIDKKLLNKKKSGVTEFLAYKNNVKNNSEVMLITNGKYSVCPITTHVDIKNISKNIKEKNIINKIKTIKIWFRKNLRKTPKIGILGLNPHNAELKTNSEEKKIIIPAIKKLKKDNINVEGPLVADTIFIDYYKKFDVIVGMYHDQVITPFKTLFKFNAINLTLGLKYLRASPDHGTARDIIGKNKANPKSLIKCINFIQKIKK